MIPARHRALSIATTRILLAAPFYHFDFGLNTIVPMNNFFGVITSMQVVR
jgi:hypothetical protein